MKRYANAALTYSIIAMVAGVFYREFTKFMGFAGKTTLGVMHTHYFALGMIFFLMLLVLEKNFAFSDKAVSKIMIFYHVGLNITGAAFLARGVFQVMGTEMTSTLNASLSGVAGIGHAVLGISMILVLLKVRKSVQK